METEWHIVYLSFEDGRVGKDYIGKHSTADLHDGYLGSFSAEDFNPEFRIILEYAKTEEAAILAEIRWQKVFQVAEDPRFANKSYQTSEKFWYRAHGENHPTYGKKLWHTSEGAHCYSQECPGPEWAWGRHPSLIEKRSQSLKGERNPNFGNRWKWEWSDAQIKALEQKPRGEEHHWSRLNRDMSGENNTFYGRRHTSESKEKMRQSHLGENSSVFRTKWWVNAKGETRRDTKSPGEGWEQGRKWRN